MKVLQLIASFLIIFAILLSFSLNNSTFTYAVEPKKLVTKEFLSNICSKSYYPTFCEDVLHHLIGRPLSKTTFSTLATKPLNLAISDAKKTQQMINIMYKSLPRIPPICPYTLKEFENCISNYKYANFLLQFAKQGMDKGVDKSKVQSAVSNAIKKINTCEYGIVLSQSMKFKVSNKRIRDICSIIIAI
ncbi:hypothetical protein ACP275_10G104500 [Erythranthe tilingii]